jgi:class 3 adenylate cyclase/tetratricopeptide (TPR) repeat protein
MRCRNCSAENADSRRFCTQCAASLTLSCRKCGLENQLDARFCSQCAASLELEGARSDLNPRDGRSGERRHLTVLFCDLVGSTTIAAQLDPEEWHDILASYHHAAAQAVGHFGGYVAQYLGDGVMAYFGWPEAHDDDAERAVRAGLAILDAIHKLNEQPSLPKLAVRVAIDSGLVVVDAGSGKDTLVFGDAPNIAARVQVAAEPGTVMITDATHRLASGLFVVEDCGAQSLKGLSRPVQLYRVIRPSGVRGRITAAAASHGLTPFVGREDELRLLTSRWERVRSGEGQVVLIIGEAGIGKSRLVQRFHEQIVHNPHTWAEAAAAPFFQNTSFYPVTETLQRFLSGTPTQDQLAQLEPLLTAAGVEPAEALPLIAPLLNLPLPTNLQPSGLAPDQARRRLLAILVKWILGSAKAQPLVIVIEDLHWIDPSSMELIKLLIDQAATAPLLLLCTARPEMRPQWPTRTYHAQITLDPLNARHVRAMVEEAAAHRPLSEGTIAMLVERSGGVPLFVEELTRVILERGDGKFTPNEIPVTLHDSLMARLDRLGTAKEALQIGAVIGGDFSYELLHAVYPIPEDALQHALRTSVDAELVYVLGVPPEAFYQFKHALICDAAYGALLKSRRRELHRRVARVIDENFTALKQAHPEVLARHWTEAGETEEAISLWCKVGDMSRMRCAFDEAQAAYKEALELLKLVPESRNRDERELSLQTALAIALQITQGYSAPETVEVGARTRALSDKLGNLGQIMLQAVSRWAALSSAGDFTAARLIADEILALASQEGNAISLAYAHMAQMTSRYRLGELVEAERYFERGSAFFENEIFKRVPGTIPQTFGNASQIALLMGRADTARRRIGYAISTAQQSANPYDEAFAQFMAAMLHLLLKNTTEAEASALRALTLSDEHKFPQFAAISRIALGRARAAHANVVEGIGLIRQGLAEMYGTRNRAAMTVYLHWLAEAQGFSGDLSAAMTAVANALSSNHAELYFRSENLRLLAELRLKQGTLEVAEAGLHDAITFAQQIGAKTSELRAATRLARLLDERGRREEARAIIERIYSGFTEGLDTADLKEAKNLLITLGSSA